MSLTEREASRFAILEQLLAGSWVGAATAMDFHNRRYPRDLVALQVGLLMDFDCGSARDLRDRLARAMPHWTDEVPGYHAQRDIIDWTLTEAALRADLADVATALAHERAALKAHSAMNRELVRSAAGTAAKH